MLHHFKNLPNLKGKKRYLVMGFLAFELMSLPAAAHIVHNAATQTRPIVTAVEIPTSEPGLSRFLVTSNSGFDVRANDVVGDVSVRVHVSGTLSSETRFGDAAQLPGPDVICAHVTTENTAVYKADRTTAAREGATTEQAVVIEFNYDYAARPNFKFSADQNNNASLRNCST